MELRIKRQRADQVVENITHIHEQITKAKRIPAAKSLNFTHISGNISVYSTPASSNTVGYVTTTKGIRKTIAKQKQQAVR